MTQSLTLWSARRWGDGESIFSAARDFNHFYLSIQEKIIFVFIAQGAYIELNWIEYFQE